MVCFEQTICNLLWAIFQQFLKKDRDDLRKKTIGKILQSVHVKIQNNDSVFYWEVPIVDTWRTTRWERICFKEDQLIEMGFTVLWIHKKENAENLATYKWTVEPFRHYWHIILITSDGLCETSIMFLIFWVIQMNVRTTPDYNSVKGEYFQMYLLFSNNFWWRVWSLSSWRRQGCQTVATIRLF